MPPPPSPPLSGEAAWTAITSRDRRADGAFVYAVRTTGVYCRPSCAARTPHRRNVTFFDRPSDAEAAGFRPCKRCRPSHPAGSPREEAALRARALIDARIDADPHEPIRLAELADAVGLSASYLQRTFTAVVGVSPSAYARSCRLETARKALQGGDTVLGAALGAGFASPKPLYAESLSMLGMTPGAYRRGGGGETIRYALFDTALGVCLVAATDVGLCAISLGDAGGALEADLRAEFPHASTVRDDGAIGPWAEPVLRCLAGAPNDPAPPLANARLAALPLDLRGTDFQRRVWAALREIPRGETRTYGEVAERLGQPTATRAVAQACARNRVALAVPCHRVVGADGALRGYRWGPERKRQLLEGERRDEGGGNLEEGGS